MKLPISMERVRTLLPFEKGTMEITAWCGKGWEKDISNYAQELSRDQVHHRYRSILQH